MQTLPTQIAAAGHAAAAQDPATSRPESEGRSASFALVFFSRADVAEEDAKVEPASDPSPPNGRGATEEQDEPGDGAGDAPSPGEHDGSGQATAPIAPHSNLSRSAPPEFSLQESLNVSTNRARRIDTPAHSDAPLDVMQRAIGETLDPAPGAAPTPGAIGANEEPVTPPYPSPAGVIATWTGHDRFPPETPQARAKASAATAVFPATTELPAPGANFARDGFVATRVDTPGPASTVTGGAAGPVAMPDERSIAPAAPLARPDAASPAPSATPVATRPVTTEPNTVVRPPAPPDAGNPIVGAEADEPGPAVVPVRAAAQDAPRRASRGDPVAAAIQPGAASVAVSVDDAAIRPPDTGRPAGRASVIGPDAAARAGPEAPAATRSLVPAENVAASLFEADPADTLPTDELDGRSGRELLSAALSRAAQNPAPHLPTTRSASAPPMLREIADLVVRNAGNRIEISLSPEELGKVRMELQHADGGVLLSISATRPETLDLMRRHLPDLGGELRALGYETVGFSLQGESDRGTGSHPAAPTEPREDRPEAAVSAPPSPSVTLSENRRPGPPPSGLDLRL